MIDLQIESYSEECAKQHAEFARKAWHGKARRANEQYLRWKFRGQKSGAVHGLLVARTASGRVVGQLGLIPGRLRYRDKVLECQWACDLMVDPEFRRRGIATLLFKAAFQRGMVTLGSNPSASAEPTMIKLGFRILDGPKIMQCPLDPREVIRWKMPERRGLTQVLGVAALPVARALQWRLLAGRQTAVPCGWRDVAQRVQEFERSFSLPHVQHDSEWLNWRCRGLEGFNEELQGIVTGERSWALVGRMGHLFRVYDWCAENFEACLAIFKMAYSLARKENAKVITAYAQDQSEQSWLKSLGFLAMRRSVKVLLHPPDALEGEERFRYALYDSDGDL